MNGYIYNKKTNNTFLILSFFGIIFVVLGHCKQINVFFNNVFPYYTFHMALFAFISGYFFKERKVKEFLKIKLRKLIIPYFLWNLIYGFLLVILHTFKIVTFGKSFSLFNIFIAPFSGGGNHFGFNVAAWFVISIFFVQLIYFIIYKTTKKIKFNNEIILLIISIVVAYYELKYVRSGNNYGLYYLITRVCFLFPFYCVGQIYKKYENKIKITGKRTYLFFCVVVLIQTFLLNKYNFEYNLQLLHFSTNYIIYFIGSLNGIVFWLKISKIISNYLKNNSVINLIGNNTYSIMMHHIFAFFLMNSLILLINRITGVFSNFDFSKYQNHFFYFYSENPGIQLIYAIVGIMLPLLGNYLYKKVKEKTFKRLFQHFPKLKKMES